MLGAKAQQRSIELHGTISNFYADDQRMIDLFADTLALTEKAIKDVEDAIGPPGSANPYNVPTAAAILGAYALLFHEPNKQLHGLADIMGDVQSNLVSVN